MSCDVCRVQRVQVAVNSVKTLRIRLVSSGKFTGVVKRLPLEPSLEKKLRTQASSTQRKGDKRLNVQMKHKKIEKFMHYLEIDDLKISQISLRKLEDQMKAEQDHK